MSDVEILAEDVLYDLESVGKHINNENYDSTLGPTILQLVANLKTFGSQLDAKYKGNLNIFNSVTTPQINLWRNHNFLQGSE